MRMILEDLSRRMHLERGYQPVFTPHIGKSILWETSGHLGFFRENMFPPMEADESDYYAKPMNCPFHILIYQSRTRSYRELPVRLSELGTVYRYEQFGTIHGILRAGMTTTMPTSSAARIRSCQSSWRWWSSSAISTARWGCSGCRPLLHETR